MTETVVALVETPERGEYLVRCPDGFPWRENVRGRRAVVVLDYGQDMGKVVSAGIHDPSVHGERLPGFRLERFARAEDDAVLAKNATLAEEMKKAFVRAAGWTGKEADGCSARLSFGGRRLFLRAPSDRRRQEDAGGAVEEVKRLFGVSVSVRRMGSRDEVASVGALGVCGRVCCCASWQRRFPARIAVPEGVNPAGANGACGRYKCCLAFESAPADGRGGCAAKKESSYPCLTRG